jgi:hypothetical protein
LGPNANISPNGGSRNAEAIIDLGSGTRSIRILTANITLKGFEIRNSANAGAIMAGTFSETSGGAAPMNTRIEKNYMHDLSGSAIALVTFSAREWNWTITDNKIQNVANGNYYGGQYGSGIQIWAGNNCSVTNNVLSNIAYIGLHMGWVGNSTFSGNIVNGFSVAGIQGFSNTFDNNVISGNEFNNSGTPAGEGIRINTNPSSLTISNNKVSGCTKGISFPDVALTGSIEITNNSLAGNTTGIYHGGAGQLDAPCNWYGSACLDMNQAKFGPVTIATVLNSGIDSDLSTNGFQPAPGTCVSAGSQPPAPTNLACWETATFNNSTCQWDVTGTQPPQPGGAVSLNTPYDISSLPGYGVATSAVFYFSAGGWAGWSVPAGKVVLGAKIISAGDAESDFAVFRPAGPGEVFPHYTYGANEYGWVMQAKSGQSNPGVQIEVYYADPVTDYSISLSPSQLNYNGGGGYGGLSAPTGRVVSGGGYHFVNSYSSASISALAVAGSSWPHYTYGSGEQGWVVRGPSNGMANPGRIYVVSFTVPSNQNCWDNYVFNNQTCQWENTGSQPPAPTNLACWETATFNNSTCQWDVTGTQPPQPPALNCWDNYQFNTGSCSWENIGTPGLTDMVATPVNASFSTCVLVALNSVTHTTSGATGIGSATGLPGGVTASWANDEITISGTPSESGTFNYSIPLTGGCGSLSATGTITVIAPGSESVEDPQFSSGTGSYSSLQYVSLSTATPGAEIYYTTNGNLPLFDVPNSFTQLYTGPITVAQTTKIYSVARLACATSLIKFAEYTFAVPLIVSTPVITPGTGTYAGAQTVTISVSTPDADIYYTTTGNEPVIGTVFTKLYTGPFILNGDATVRAMGVKSGMGNSSVAVAYLTFSSTTPICATPVISPATGSYTSPQTVNITCSTPGSTIYYTTNGNEPLLNPFPNSFTSVFSSSFPLSGSGEITIRAMATAPGFMPSSVEVSVITLSGGTPRQAVDQNISAQELVVSPNPSSGRFFISIPAEYYQEAMSLQVLNTAGKLISNRSVKAEGSEMISLEDQPQGIYLLKVQTGGMQKTFRLVKN